MKLVDYYDQINNSKNLPDYYNGIIKSYKLQEGFSKSRVLIEIILVFSSEFLFDLILNLLAMEVIETLDEIIQNVYFNYQFSV